MSGGALPITVTDTGQAVVSCTRLFGVNVFETAGAAAVVALYDGTSTSGVVLGKFNLAADGGQTVWFDGGISASSVFVDVTSGAVSVTVYAR